MRWGKGISRRGGTKYLFLFGGALSTARLGWSWLRTGQGRLRGQVAVVTGGSRGLGLLLARELAQQGCKLVICARDEAELGRARRYLEGHGADVLSIPCDVSNREDVANMVARTIARWGGIDVLVNNCDGNGTGPLQSMNVADFERAMAVNFWGSVYTTLAVLPGMRERRRGRIVNVTSIGGKGAAPHLLPYDCAKLAAMGFSEGLRAELKSEGISITTVVPFKATSTSQAASAQTARVARRIVYAAERRRPEITIGWRAKLLRMCHALFPGLTTRVAAVANRALPHLPGRTRADARRAVPGAHLQQSPAQA